MVGNCLLLKTPTCNFPKFVISFLQYLITNEFTVKKYFHFAKQIVDQIPHLFMGCLDVESGTVVGISKYEFMEMLYLAKISFLI